MKMVLMGLGVFVLLVIVFLAINPVSRAVLNSWDTSLHRIDDRTTYETKKEVEDTCRSMIASYESDKLTWEQYKDKTGERLEWADAAKMRANKTAVTYNEYVLKNNFVFNGNIPDDIKEELDIIE